MNRRIKEDSDDSPETKPKEPIFLERGDGLGWTLNFDRPISYLILVLILAVPICVAIIAFSY